MKTKTKFQLTRLLVVFTAVIGFLSAGVTARAIGPRDALKEAYASLSVANHDYEGHRMGAIREIQAAGRIMGMDLRGQSRGTESDRQSEDHLRYARSMLQQVRAQNDYLDRKDRDRVQQHVNQAIREINSALKEPNGSRVDPYYRR